MFWVTRSEGRLDLVRHGSPAPIVNAMFTVTPACNPGCMQRNEAWSSVAEWASIQHGAFSRDQATKAKLNAQHLRRACTSGRIQRVLSDVFVFSSAPDTWLRRHIVVSLAGGVVSHASAAALHNLDGFARASGPIHVSFDRGSERRLPHATVHRWRFTSRNDITNVEGIQCTSVARTLFQLGSGCTRDQVEVALDSALRQGVNPAWIEDTADRLRRPGPTGGNVLTDLMYDPARGGALSESVLEKVVERMLNDSRLPAVIRQHPVQLRSGIRRLDLALPRAKLGIEGHSRRHHFGQENDTSDTLRDLQLAAAGWEVIYVTWKLAHQPNLLVDLIVDTYEQRRALLANAA